MAENITFLHGFLGSSEDWNLIRETLPLPSQALLLPGHGNTFLPHGFNRVVDFLKKQIQQPTILVGYSLGGRLALYFAKKYPTFIKKLIILSANPGIESPQKRAQQDEAWKTLIEEKGFHAFLKKWYEQPLFHSFTQLPCFEQIFAKRLKENPETMKRILCELSPAKQTSFWEAIEKFSFPTHFLFGEHDIRYQPIYERLKALGGNVKANLIEESGHAIHLENPRLCAEKIRGFIYDA